MFNALNLCQLGEQNNASEPLQHHEVSSHIGVKWGGAALEGRNLTVKQTENQEPAKIVVVVEQNSPLNLEQKLLSFYYFRVPAG